MKILVIGDYIEDDYVFGKAMRLCPEAPVPVLVPELVELRDGGAGLVTAQLRQFGALAIARYGSFSRKERYFAGNHLLCRVDRDNFPSQYDKFEGQPIEPSLEYADAIVVSDYGKGAMSKELAAQIVSAGKPIFVDAKHHWSWYSGPNTIAFPNEHEFFSEKDFGCVVRKLGAKGCKLNSAEPIPATTDQVVDVTGAGDIFMASFVFAWTQKLKPAHCLRFANTMAGESCRHIGTYVVPKAFGLAYLDRLRALEESEQQARDYSRDSSQSGPLLPLESAPGAVSLIAEKFGILRADYAQVGANLAENLHTALDAQTPLESPLGPTVQSDTRTQADQENSAESGSESQSDCKSQSSSESARQYGHTRELDQAAPVLRPKPQA